MRMLRRPAARAPLPALPTPISLDAAEPVEAAVLPIATRIGVGDLDRGDPFWVLVAELGRGAQPQREPERICDRLPGVFRCQDRLRMQRRRHVDAAVIAVGALEGDIFGGEIGTDA